MLTHFLLCSIYYYYRLGQLGEKNHQQIGFVTTLVQIPQYNSCDINQDISGQQLVRREEYKPFSSYFCPSTFMHRADGDSPIIFLNGDTLCCCTCLLPILFFKCNVRSRICPSSFSLLCMGNLWCPSFQFILVWNGICIENWTCKLVMMIPFMNTICGHFLNFHESSDVNLYAAMVLALVNCVPWCTPIWRSYEP